MKDSFKRIVKIFPSFDVQSPGSEYSGKKPGSDILVMTPARTQSAKRLRIGVGTRGIMVGNPSYHGLRTWSLCSVCALLMEIIRMTSNYRITDLMTEIALYVRTYF